MIAENNRVTIIFRAINKSRHGNVCNQQTKKGAKMAVLIKQATIIPAAGNKPKIINEFIGCVNSKNTEVSIAKMVSPQGWIEPGQTPEFDEFTVVLKGTLKVETKAETLIVEAGSAVIAHKGEWVKYSTPEPEGAEYIAVCLPAFSPGLVHRDE